MASEYKMKTRVHILVSGKVQGVFFRKSTKNKAQELDITGWVRNLDDGRVEAVFEGEKEKVEKMVEWARKGPDYAEVKDIKIMRGEYKGEFRGFTVLRY